MDSKEIIKNMPIGGRVKIAVLYRYVSPKLVYLPMKGMDAKERTAIFEQYGYYRNHNEKGTWIRLCEGRLLNEYHASQIPLYIFMECLKCSLQEDKQYTDNDIRILVNAMISRGVLSNIMFYFDYVYVGGVWRHKNSI